MLKNFYKNAPWLLGLLAIMFLNTAASAQDAPTGGKKSGKSKGLLTHFSLGGQLPAADLSARFGINGTLGAGLEYLNPDNWLFGLEGAFLFGSKVKEDPLSIIRTPEGGIIGNNRTVASVRLQQRGLYLGGHVGKLITFSEKRRGLRVTFGGGWAQHSIHPLDDSRTVNQIRGRYKKGYDRLTGGPALQQFVGWEHVGYGRDMSWMVGLEFNQAFTQTRRDWDFSEMRKLEGQRLDLRFGVRLAWTLPFYTGYAEDIYY
jgi:hypothetical protein